MSLGVSESTTTWDAARVGLPQPMVREESASYAVRRKMPLDFMSVLMQGTTSTDVRFLLGGAGDLLWDASVLGGLPGRGAFYNLPLMIRPQTTQERGPLGGRLISLAEACRLADEALFMAERERQAARERDALYWSDLEDEP
ncbi:MAG: hypothetical protein WBV59_25830 [Anaerolineae bacterium]